MCGHQFQTEKLRFFKELTFNYKLWILVPFKGILDLSKVTIKDIILLGTFRGLKANIKFEEGN